MYLLIAAGLGAWGYHGMIRMPGQSYEGALPELTSAQLELLAELQHHVEHLGVTIGERNLFRPGALRDSAEYIRATWTDAGFTDIRSQQYAVRGVTCANLEVEIPGTVQPGEIVVIGAHYDSVPGSPGANDNGSGVAALLALSRRYAHQQPHRTLRFVAFVNEEPPFFQTSHMGSLVYARQSREQGENIVAMISLETIGYYSDAPGSQRYPPPFGLFYPSQGNFIAVVGHTGSGELVRRAIRVFRETTPFPSEGAALPSWIPGVGWSDHWSFWRAGYPGIMITDTAPFRYPHYHSAHDLPAAMDFDRMARVVDGLHHVIDDLTGRDLLPDLADNRNQGQEQGHDD